MKWLAVAVAFAVFFAQQALAEPGFESLDKIDAHMHLYGDMPAFVERMETDGFRVLTVNVSYRDFPPLAEQQRDAAAMHRNSPSLIAFAASFDAAGSEAPGWLERVKRQLEAAFDQGAVAVKVWKDIGMQQRDADGRVVMIDDPRFDPLFDWLAEKGVPVLGHQGEPRNAWLPLEQMTIRGDRQYFAEHPQYHMAGRKDWPTYEEQIAARDRMLSRHPGLKFVGVHLASLEWDIDRIADFLRRYPNASVDLAARLSHLQLQASRDREKVRRFFIEFQDRILYGSDFARARGQTDDSFTEDAHAGWLEDWHFLAGDEPQHSEEFDGPFQGLALPQEVLAKVYAGNARRLFPTAWGSTGAEAQP